MSKAARVGTAIVAESFFERLVGLLLVLILHMTALYGLWSARLMPSPEEAATLFVNFIAPPPPPKV